MATKDLAYNANAYGDIPVLERLNMAMRVKSLIQADSPIDYEDIDCHTIGCASGEYGTSKTDELIGECDMIFSALSIYGLSSVDQLIDLEIALARQEATDRTEASKQERYAAIAQQAAERGICVAEALAQSPNYIKTTLVRKKGAYGFSSSQQRLSLWGAHDVSMNRICVPSDCKKLRIMLAALAINRSGDNRPYAISMRDHLLAKAGLDSISGSKVQRFMQDSLDKVAFKLDRDSDGRIIRVNEVERNAFWVRTAHVRWISSMCIKRKWDGEIKVVSQNLFNSMWSDMIIIIVGNYNCGDFFGHFEE